PLVAVSPILGGAGVFIATDVSPYLVRGEARSAGDPSGTAPRGAPAGRAREELVAPRPTGRWTLPADAGRRYGAVSGDVNPIHLSALSAEACGFPGALGHGLCPSSCASRESRAHLCRQPSGGLAFDA